MKDAGPFGFTRLTRPKPTIAAISGWCLAGARAGAVVRPADRHRGLHARLPERRWGVPLIDGGTQRLPRIVGMGRALDLILTGRMVEPEEALAGMITEVVAPGKHLARALEIAEGLAGFPQSTMLADPRRALAGFGLPLDAALAVEAMSGPSTFLDAQAGRRAFAGGEGRGGAGAGV